MSHHQTPLASYRELNQRTADGLTVTLVHPFAYAEHNVCEVA
jgi:hypothetical protein